MNNNQIWHTLNFISAIFLKNVVSFEKVYVNLKYER